MVTTVPAYVGLRVVFYSWSAAERAVYYFTILGFAPEGRLHVRWCDTPNGPHGTTTIRCNQARTRVGCRQVVWP